MRSAARISCSNSPRLSPLAILYSSLVSNLPIHLSKRRQPRIVADETFGSSPSDETNHGLPCSLLHPRPRNWPNGSDRLSPVPEVRFAVAEFLEDMLVAFFEVADECVTILEIKE